MLFVATIALTAAAAAAEIEIDAPDSSTIGLPVTVVVTVTEGGQAVPEVEVTLTREATLGGVFGFPELASAVTDVNGVAVLEFVQRADENGSGLYRVDYEGTAGPASADFEMTVNPGPQQYVATAGVDSGLASVWWLYVVLAIIWGSLAFAVYQLLVVAKAGDRQRSILTVPYIMLGFVIFTGVGMFVVVANRPATHLVLTPNEQFDRDPAALVGVDYEYTGHDGHGDAGLGGSANDDLDGEALYVRAGCAGCHGLANSGQGVVGGHLSTFNLSDAEVFAGFVRLGPGGMPGYAEALLSDDEVQRIRDWALSEVEATGGRTVGVLSAVVEGPSVGEPGEGLVFDGSNSVDANGPIVAYRWDFGDGGPVVDFGTASAVVEHSFLTDGIYEVTLTVVDVAGTSASASTMVLIGDAHPPVTGDSEGEQQAEEAEDTSPGPSTAESVEAGAEIFASSCAACHGPNAVGGDLADSTLSLDQLRSIIVNGEGAMPAFGGQLTEEQVDRVVDYVRSLGEE